MKNTCSFKSFKPNYCLKSLGVAQLLVTRSDKTHNASNSVNEFKECYGIVMQTVLPIFAFCILIRCQCFYTYQLQKKRDLHDSVVFKTSRYYNKQNLKYLLFVLFGRLFSSFACKRWSIQREVFIN